MPKVDPIKLEEAVKLVVDGGSYYQASRQTGISVGSIKRNCEAAGIKSTHKQVAKKEEVPVL